MGPLEHSSGHTRACESIGPTRDSWESIAPQLEGARHNHASASPHLKWPNQGMRVHLPYLRGHTEGWDSIPRNRVVAAQHGSPLLDIEAPGNMWSPNTELKVPN